MKHVSLPIFLLILCIVSPSKGWCGDSEQSANLAKVFSEAGVEGTFVLFDVSDNRLVIHNKTRAQRRFIPASTFKIPNSLIGLASGAISNVDEILPYGGGPQYLKSWEQDMGIRDAIKISNVPVYQELARRIGLQRMSEFVDLLDYGNQTIGNKVDKFWLEGPLQISAIEQTQFLARLALGQLPMAKGVQSSVRDIVKIEQHDDWALFAKTGWAVSSNPDIGWWVGWLEKHGQIYSFALNIDMPIADYAKKRIKIGKASLKALCIIEECQNHQ